MTISACCCELFGSRDQCGVRGLDDHLLFDIKSMLWIACQESASPKFEVYTKCPNLRSISCHVLRVEDGTRYGDTYVIVYGKLDDSRFSRVAFYHCNVFGFREQQPAIAWQEY